MAVESAKSFVFGSQDYSLSGYDVIVENFQAGTRIPFFRPPRLDVQPLTGASGVVTQGTTFDEWRITLACVTLALDGDPDTRLTNIGAALATAHPLGEQTLTLGAFAGRSWKARITGNSLDPRYYAGGAYFMLNFIVASGADI